MASMVLDIQSPQSLGIIAICQFTGLLLGVIVQCLWSCSVSWCLSAGEMEISSALLADVAQEKTLVYHVISDSGTYMPRIITQSERAANRLHDLIVTLIS